MKTMLIAGSASGFGPETARFFPGRDWTVIATMRTPRADVMQGSDWLRILALDVTDAASIARALEEAGQADALVNNAGAGLIGTLEGSSIDATGQLFEPDTFGTMAMTQAILPNFRAQEPSSKALETLRGADVHRYLGDLVCDVEESGVKPSH